MQFFSLIKAKCIKRHQLQKSNFKTAHKRWILPLKSSENNENIYKESIPVGRNVRNYAFPLFRLGPNLEVVEFSYFHRMILIYVKKLVFKISILNKLV